MRTAQVGAAVVALVIAVGGGSYWMGKQSGSQAAPSSAQAGAAKGGPPAGISIEAVKVQMARLPQALAAVGSLRSDETIIVRPEIPGRVAEIHFKEGERVAKGAQLVRLEASVQKADLDKARANLMLSKSKFERAEDLRKQGFISGQARDEAENTYKVMQAEADLMEARVSKTSIVAPFAGTIGLRQVSVGDYVKEGQDIVNLEAIDPLKVDFRVPEVALSQVKAGQTLQVTLDAIPDRAFDGRVYAINPLIDAAGRSVVIRAQVSNRDGSLRPGMFARVRLFTSDLRDSAMVPEEALFPVGDEKYVWKVVDGKAVRQKVEIGQRRDSKVEIISGLDAADMVITEGHLKMREGVGVKVAAPPTAAPAQPALDTSAQKTKG
jgi:membrane fusion protein (multidrug efflux system)